MVWKNKWLPLFVGILTALLMVSFTACGEKTPAAENTEPMTEDEAIWGTVPEETLGVAVETPFMTFHYPQDWQGKVTAERVEEENRSVTSFRTELSGKSVELFSVILSRTEEDGYLLGQLMVEDGENINVYTCMNQLSPENWTEEELLELSALQERVNDIIAQFYENEAFQPEQ